MPRFRAALATLGLNVNNLLGINHKTFDLTVEQFDLFKTVYIKHLNAMDTDARKKRTIEHVESIVWDSEEKCLKVYFDDSEWWHYTKDLTWYYEDKQKGGRRKIILLFFIVSP